jgi:hypothetical protein
MVESMPMSEVAIYVDVIDNEGALKGVNEEYSSRQSHDTSITLEDSSLNTYRPSQDRHPLAGTGLRHTTRRTCHNVALQRRHCRHTTAYPCLPS